MTEFESFNLMISTISCGIIYSRTISLIYHDTSTTAHPHNPTHHSLSVSSASPSADFQHT